MASSIRNSDEEIPAKKIKLTNEESQDDNSDLHTFRSFQLIKVLNENAQAKTVVVHGERLAFFNLHLNLFLLAIKLLSLNFFNLLVKGYQPRGKRCWILITRIRWHKRIHAEFHAGYNQPALTKSICMFLFRALLWNYVIALITVIQRPFAGNVLRSFYYITFVTYLYSHYCYFVCNFDLFILFN